LLEQLNAALAAVKIEPKDVATAELARHYAGLIDNAAPAGKYLKALAWLHGGASQEDEKAGDYTDVIMLALSEHSSASDFGPKLLAALTSLGMTPAAAGIIAPTPGAVPRSPLDQLRQRRQEKAQGVV
jgi:hypothetical protein